MFSQCRGDVASAPARTDFKTIADFRRDNGAAIVGACRAFVLFCRDQGLFTARLVALDGSKFRAAASAKRIMAGARSPRRQPVLTGGSPIIWPDWTRAMPANPTRRQARLRPHFRPCDHAEPSSIA